MVAYVKQPKSDHETPQASTEMEELDIEEIRTREADALNMAESLKSELQIALKHVMTIECASFGLLVQHILSLVTFGVVLMIDFKGIESNTMDGLGHICGTTFVVGGRAGYALYRVIKQCVLLSM